MDAAHIDVLETHGRYIKAADVHVLNGRSMAAILCCLKNQEDETTFRHGVNIILDVLWEKCLLAVSMRKALKNGTSAAHVLELALNLSQDPLDVSEKSRYGGTTAIWVCGIEYLTASLVTGDPVMAPDGVGTRLQCYNFTWLKLNVSSLSPKQRTQ